jgi:very-short-patch-repair endonuclease
MGGQHADPKQAEYDARRTAWLRERGYRVYRVWNFETPKEWDAIADHIWELLREAGPPASARGKSAEG